MPLIISMFAFGLSIFLDVSSGTEIAHALGNNFQPIVVVVFLPPLFPGNRDTN